LNARFAPALSRTVPRFVNDRTLICQGTVVDLSRYRR
jgi:hypothetical protein